MSIQSNFKNGYLLTASCLTSRWSWLYGQLWLFPDGLLRLPLPWWTGASQGYTPRPTVSVGALENRAFDEAFWLQLTINPKNIWIPSNHIVKAYLHRDMYVERLRVELIDNSEVKLFWMRPDQASVPLEVALNEWLGLNVPWE
ncbi:MAG TPA: hypothetical protein VGM01_10220 [Ktedonobacteraceae bacterium]